MVLLLDLDRRRLHFPNSPVVGSQNSCEEPVNHYLPDVRHDFLLHHSYRKPVERDKGQTEILKQIKGLIVIIT